ncbi:unnamed protein product [Brachionus calyciflorus]|uniref:Uncharacterized protein n=1 Tax=Brachionus calyciflorus TaxID=104777 RepID=A0A813RMH4_9BILA|nr:unnamed protein product [Brachionus calyciflorus]
MIWNFLIVFIFLNGIFCQGQDLEFCDINKIQPDPEKLQIPAVDLNSQYQAVLERNALGVTEEIKEYYDGKNNIGIAITTDASLKTSAYAYFSLNELLLVMNKKCVTYKLNESYSLTPFFLVTDQQGNEHIVSPLTVALRNLTFIYTGSSSSIRGIPVNEWQTCAYSSKEKRTYKITVSFSNPKKWSPAEISANFPSVPVQTKIESLGQDGSYKSEVLSVFKYKSRLDLTLEDYFVPSGVYCPGRINLKSLPTMPKSFTFSNQLSETIVEVLDKAGKIDYLREDYDYNYKLFRFDYDKANQAFSEIHDFTTGLNYIINRKTGECKIDILKAGQVDSQLNGTNVEIRDPSAFFDFDGADFQYVGERRQDGINTDVWIGRKTINGLESILEWYFMAESWNKTDLSQKYVPTPIKFITYTTAKLQNATGVLKVTNNIFNFRETELNLFEYDIRSCVTDLEKQSFLFSVSVGYTDVIRSNLRRFQEAVVLAIQKIARVVLLRITVPQVAFYSDFVIVTFDLYERSKIYGNVLVPMDDLILRDAVENLKDFFKFENLEISFIDDLEKNVTVVIFSNSLNDHVDSEGYVTFQIEKVDKGFSSTSVFVITLIVIAVGALFGLYLIQLHSLNKINLPFLKLFY